MKKFIGVLMITLFGGSLGVGTVSASKVPDMDSSYWMKPRSVKLKKTVTVKEYKMAIPEYKSKKIAQFKLKKGKNIKIVSSAGGWLYVKDGKLIDDGNYQYRINQINYKWFRLK